MKVVVTDFIETDLEWEAERFRQESIEFKAFQLKYASELELAAAAEDADVVIVNMAPITSRVIDGWQKCRLVIRHGIGFDNVDIEALGSRGIPLVNMPDYCTEEVAEQAIALILACGRKIFSSRRILDSSVSQGCWNFNHIHPIHRLCGQTLGIIGCGRIGSRVYRKLSSFGYEFAICDPYLSSRRKAHLGIETESLDSVLARSDFVTLHTPLNHETEHLINEQTLSLMKPTAYLINTARAGLVDQNALVSALRNRRIAGAGLDVFLSEPPDPEDPLLSMDNVVLTPHLSWCSLEAERLIREKIVAQVLRFRDGEPPENVVNEDYLKAIEASL